MKILFDHQAFLIQQTGGISRYFSELISGLSRSGAADPLLSVRESANVNYQRIILKNGHYAPPGITQQVLKRISGKIFPASKESYRNRTMSVAQLMEGSYDIFHPTYYDPYYVDYLQGKPVVATVFDLIHELFPEYFAEDRRNEMLEHKRNVIEGADHVIAISEQTKKDLIAYYGIDQKKITTVYLASSLSAPMPRERGWKNNGPRYVLFVGTREIYKNFDTVIETMKEIVAMDNAMQLWCAGPPFSRAELSRFDHCGLSKHVRHFSPDDEQLKKLYSQAVCLVYPSKYEGFGLPVLEAFSCGCPAVVSRTSSLPEVGGDAVLYCDPEHAGSVREAIHRLMESEHEREHLIEKGYLRVQLFSWNKTVSQTAAVYSETLKKGRSS